MTPKKADEIALAVGTAACLLLALAAIYSARPETHPMIAHRHPALSPPQERMIDPMPCTHCARLDQESDRLAEQVRDLSDSLTACMSAEESPFKAERDRLAAQVAKLSAELIKAQKARGDGAQRRTPDGGVSIEIRDIPWMDDRPALRVVESETE